MMETAGGDHSVAVLAVAMVIDGMAGYPPSLLRLIGHPAMWLGGVIGWLDRTANRADGTAKAAGVLALLAVLALVAVVTVPVALACRATPWGWWIEAVLASCLLAQRSLRDHVEAVAEGLGESLDKGRTAVSMIVGRDPATLDEAGVARAAIESLSENFSDGVIAPAFWLLVGGLPGIALYKAINTADSMIGHRTPRHHAFGWASARLDDVVNLPGARLTALLIAAGAALCPEADAGAALAAAWRDAGKHRSPNAGWPEAAMAGALGLRLAGPRVYGGVPVADAWMGDGRERATAADIEKALEVYRRACLIATALAAAGYAWASGW